MNSKSAYDKKERKHWPCVRDMSACVCICQPRDLLSEQLAAHAAPQLGPGVAVPLEHGGLRLAGQIVLVLVHAAVLLQTLAHRVQVHIRHQDLRHPKRCLEKPPCSVQRLLPGGSGGGGGGEVKEEEGGSEGVLIPR